MQVHAEAEGDDGGLQQKFRQALAFDVKGMVEGESVDQSAQKRDGRRDQAAGRQDQCQEKNMLLLTNWSVTLEAEAASKQ